VSESSVFSGCVVFWLCNSVYQYACCGGSVHCLFSSYTIDIVIEYIYTPRPPLRPPPPPSPPPPPPPPRDDDGAQGGEPGDEASF